MCGGVPGDDVGPLDGSQNLLGILHPKELLLLWLKNLSFR